MTDEELWANRWRLLGRLAAPAAAMVVTLWIVGWALVFTDPLAPIRRVDAYASLWVLESRNSVGDVASGYGSALSDTLTCIAVLIITATLMRLWLGRWLEAVTLMAAIGGELLIFLAVTGVIPRDRPDVPLMDPAPPTSSFPSGHSAAAVALYGCLAVLLAWRLQPRWLAFLLGAILWTIPAVVGASRLYRGMHHLSDVVIGLVAGGVWLLIVLAVLRPERELPPPEPARDEARAAGSA